ncbi:hypothetical protein [Nevskia sp.]|uniref:hypothetical protein n=1 Tax=Nevskia sp. TaxID=1929292 RepID=UPI0025F4266A|nr:hypothetical protein [Nevskia sp.]
MKADPLGSTDGMPAWAAARAELSEVLVGLTDLQLRTIVTTRMALAIYLLCVAGVAAINTSLSVLVFGYSLALEVILSIFRILVNLETLMGHGVTFKGQTETIVDRTEIIALPRIQFWKPRRSRKNQEQDDGQSGTDAR